MTKEGTDKNNHDNGGTRSGDDRRKDQTNGRTPDSRSGKDRRKGSDRRNGLGRRRPIERRDIFREGNEKDIPL